MAIAIVRVAEVVEVVEHEIHILLFFTLQVVDDSLILVHFDADVGVSLPRNCPWLNKASCLLVHVVASLCSRHIMPHIRVQPLLPPAHRLIIEFAALFLQLVVADVECVSAEAVVAHSHLILLSIQMIEHLIVVLVVIINPDATGIVIDLL